MRSRFVPILIAVALAAACGTPEDTAGDSTTSGVPPTATSSTRPPTTTVPAASATSGTTTSPTRASTTTSGDTTTTTTTPVSTTTRVTTTTQATTTTTQGTTTTSQVTTTTTRATTTTSGAAEARIEIEGFAFDGPADVPVGTVVTVVNRDSVAHTWTSTDGAFDSGRLEPGDSFTYVFDQPGEFGFFCAIHPSMAGTIRVGG